MFSIAAPIKWKAWITSTLLTRRRVTGHADLPAGSALTLDAVELALELAPTELVLVGSTGTLFCLFLVLLVLMEDDR